MRQSPCHDTAFQSCRPKIALGSPQQRRKSQRAVAPRRRHSPAQGVFAIAAAAAASSSGISIIITVIILFHQAVREGHLDIVQLLLTEGADPAIINIAGLLSCH